MIRIHIQQRHGEHAGRQQPLALRDGEPQIIGSAANAAVRFCRQASPHVAPEHARLTVIDGQVWFENLGAAAGSFVNGQRILAPVVLRSGAEVTLGDATTAFTVHIHAAAPPPPPPPPRARRRTPQSAAPQEPRPRREWGERPAHPRKARSEAALIAWGVGGGVCVLALVIGIRSLTSHRHTPEDSSAAAMAADSAEVAVPTLSLAEQLSYAAGYQAGVDRTNKVDSEWADFATLTDELGELDEAKYREGFADGRAGRVPEYAIAFPREGIFGGGSAKEHSDWVCGRRLPSPDAYLSYNGGYCDASIHADESWETALATAKQVWADHAAGHTFFAAYYRLGWTTARDQGAPHFVVRQPVSMVGMNFRAGIGWGNARFLLPEPDEASLDTAEAVSTAEYQRRREAGEDLQHVVVEGIGIVEEAANGQNFLIIRVIPNRFDDTVPSAMAFLLVKPRPDNADRLAQFAERSLVRFRTRVRRNIFFPKLPYMHRGGALLDNDVRLTPMSKADYERMQGALHSDTGTVEIGNWNAQGIPPGAISLAEWLDLDDRAAANRVVYVRLDARVKAIDFVGFSSSESVRTDGVLNIDVGITGHRRWRTVWLELEQHGVSFERQLSYGRVEVKELWFRAVEPRSPLVVSERPDNPARKIVRIAEGEWGLRGTLRD